MSDASRTKIASIVESAFATQETDSDLQILRITGESLKQDTTIQASNEIRSDRQIANHVRTMVSGSGSLDFELSYGSWDEQLAAVLLDSAWSSAVNVAAATTIAFVASGNHITDSGSGLAGLLVGQWIKVSGATNAGNNGYFKVLTSAAGDITVTGVTLTDETAGASVTIVMGSQILNGTTLNTFNFERTYEDLSNELVLYKGFAPNQLSLTIPAEGIITGSFSYIGSSEESLTTSGGTGYTAATTTIPMSGVEDVDHVLENYVVASSTGLTLSINNNLASRIQMGNLGSVSSRSGVIDIQGTYQQYFASKAIADKYLNYTSSSISVILEDAAGNAYVIELPQIKYTDATRVVGGVSTDVIMDMSFAAYMDADEDITIRISRWDAA